MSPFRSEVGYNFEGAKKEGGLSANIYSRIATITFLPFLLAAFCIDLDAATLAWVLWDKSREYTIVVDGSSKEVVQDTDDQWKVRSAFDSKAECLNDQKNAWLSYAHITESICGKQIPQKCKHEEIKENRLESRDCLLTCQTGEELIVIPYENITFIKTLAFKSGKIKSTARISEFRCFPDTVDPRAQER
jgi:hypothetical protein